MTNLSKLDTIYEVVSKSYRKILSFLEKGIEMYDNISCCGRDCYDCIHFPHDCLGCNEVKGRVFWLEFVDEVICPIYNCCQNKMEHYECTECVNFPCAKFSEEDEEVLESIPAGIETIQPKWIEIKVS